jgi:multidrug efflux pump subunit AcrB/ABC-type multidrug transport system ATPase subunit
MNLTELAVKRPIATTMAFIALSLLGAVSYYLLPVQLLPNLVFPQLRMMVAMPSASPDQIEKDLVIPVEGAIASLEGVKSIQSFIYPDRADISISFNFGTDMRYAYLKLEQKAGALRKDMPEQAFVQTMRFDTSDMTNVLMQLVVGGPGDLDRLRNIAKEDIVPALESVDGVVNVAVFGGKEYAVEVIVDEDKCEAYGVPLLSVGQAIAASNRRTEYLGDINDGDRRYFVSLSGQFNTIAELRELPLDATRQVLLKDVAEVQFGRKDADRISRIDGDHAVMLVVRKDSLANMLRVARNVYREIDTINAEFKDREIQVRIVEDMADTVAVSIRRVEKLALFGVALALGVLLIFLKRLRTVSIILVAIPVSLLITFNLMYFAGLSINLLSLVGFAFAIGLLVDNSVVVIENSFRCAGRNKDGLTAAIQGTKEVAMPITAMTGTTIIAFLPVLFLVNSEFRIIMQEFVYSIGSPLIVSVFVSLTLVPMLAARTIDRRGETKRKHYRFLEIYVTILKFVLRRRAFTVVMTLVLFFITLIICLPISFFMSETVERAQRLEYSIDFPRGTSIERAGNLTAKLEELAENLPDVKMVHSTIDLERAQVTVEFLDPEDRTVDLDIGGMRRQIDRRVRTIEGLGRNRVRNARDAQVGGSDENQDSMDAFATSGSPERIEVRGEDSETLERIALQIKQRLSRSFEKYMNPPRTAIQPGGPELEIRGQRDVLARWGLTMSDLSNVVWFARPRGDAQLVPFRTRGQDIDILVRMKESKKRTISDLERMKIRTPDGHYLDLGEIAEIKVGESSKRILRREQQHELRVEYSFRSDIVRSASRLKALQNQVDEVIGAMVLPQGYTLKIVHKEDDDHSMRWAMIAAVACVFLLLAALFEDVSTPLCVMATFPLAIIGVLWGLVITQTGIDHYMVWVGLIMLVGIVVNDAILTLGQSRLLLKKGYGRTRAVLEGGRNRLRPVMMTTATTVLAMLPLAIRRGGESEMWPPFAITVIFGLLASTFFTLLFIPALYLSFKDIGDWLRSVGAFGLAIAISATASLVYFGFMRAGWVTSWVWIAVLTPSAFFAAVAVVWTVIRAVTAVKHVSVFQDEDLHISIRNLTKSYGTDNKFMQDWKIKNRRESGMRARGEGIVNKRHLCEDLIWKAPLFGLLGYFHFYFENEAWLFITACATWVALHNLIRTLGMLAEGDAFLDLSSHGSLFRRVLWWCALRLPTFAWAGYLYWRLRGELWVVILLLIIALLLQGLRDVAVQARRAGTAPAKRRGLLGRVKSALLRIPLIAGVRPQVHALAGVNLDIGKGMFGLLGPNGAGKTTLMRILCNVYEPSCGCIKINGRNIRHHRADVQPIIGYLPQHFGLYGDFTVYEYLAYFALLNDILDKEERVTLVKSVIRDVHLEDRMNDKISSLSGGMKQRVGIAQTLLHLPKIIVVDEPTAGLDPIERIRFRNLLAELGKDRIVIFSTHITEDVMSACHDLAVIDNGRVLFQGPPEDLQQLAVGKVREVVVSPADVQALADRVRVISQVTEAQGIRMRFVVTDDAEDEGEDVAPTLEDAYVYLLRS